MTRRDLSATPSSQIFLRILATLLLLTVVGVSTSRAQSVLLAGLDPLYGTAWSFQVTGSPTPQPLVIVGMNRDVTLWSVFEPGGTVTPEYSTNLGAVPIEWLNIPVFSNTPVNGTNVFTFAPPIANALVVLYRLQRNM